MFARVSIFEASPESSGDTLHVVREKVLPPARRMDGFGGLLILEDRAGGKSMGITFWQTEEALRASEEAAGRLREDSAAETGEEIVGVERYEVTLDERGETR